MIPKYKASDPKYEHSLTFSNHEIRSLWRPHDDALVISLNVANVLLRRMLVDTRSLSNIIFLSVLKEMGVENVRMKNVQVNLVGFLGE